jgi:hypothetical protein
MIKRYKEILRYALLSLVFVIPSIAKADTISSTPINVPDSLLPAIEKVLRGDAKIVDIAKETNLVVIKGDTVSEILKERNFGRFDRGLFNYIFIPKGDWQFGVTASYGEFSSSDLQMLDLLSDFDFKGHSFSIKPYISYFIRSNISVGLRFGYSSSKANLGSLVMDFDDDLNLDIKDVMYRSESYTSSIFVRQYLGLSRRGRFGIFNELELGFSSGNSDFRRPYNGVPVNTHTTHMEAKLSFSPGLTVFMMKNVSFNVSFGVFGFYLRNEKQQVDGEERGNRFTSGANFKINIFNINFGLGIHL